MRRLILIITGQLNSYKEAQQQLQAQQEQLVIDRLNSLLTFKHLIADRILRHTITGLLDMETANTMELAAIFPDLPETAHHINELHNLILLRRTQLLTLRYPETEGQL